MANSHYRSPLPSSPPPPPPSPPPPSPLPHRSAMFGFGFLSGDHDDGQQFFEPKENTYDLNSKIMLTAIISLSFVVVLVIVLHIYARCVLRRHARDRAIIRTLGLSTTADNHSGEPPKSGLDPAVIASLPIFVYERSCHDDDDDDDGSLIECAVCLSFLEDQEMARTLPNCKHSFHAECIDKWLSSHSNCPICRTEAEPRIQPVQREGPVGGSATAPPLLERVNSTLEGTSENGNQFSSNCNNKQLAAAGGSSSISRLSSFRRIISRERSSRRLQSEIQEQGFEDLERQ